jgi:hypothetical protein
MYVHGQATYIPVLGLLTSVLWNLSQITQYLFAYLPTCKVG